MVEKPYYQAAQSGTTRHKDLKEAINQLGRREADHYATKYGRGPDERPHYEIEIGSWAYGPLLYIERINRDGETEKPTIGKNLTQTIFQAGYAPSSFRPEKTGSPAGGRDHTGRWQWYLYPLDEVRDEESHIFESVYAIEQDDGTFLRNDAGNLVTFDRRKNAEAVADRVQDETVVEVNA